MSSQKSAGMLGAFLTSSSLIHFVRPQTFTGIVPAWVPGSPRQVVYASGAAELACAALVALPATRRLGGYAAAALFVAVFPANLKMAVDGGVPRDGGGMASRGFAYVRLPLQIPLVLWGWRVARSASR